MLSACKQARYDSDGDTIMDSAVEYAEGPVGDEFGPTEPVAVAVCDEYMATQVKVELETGPSPAEPVVVVCEPAIIKLEVGNELGPAEPVVVCTESN